MGRILEWAGFSNGQDFQMGRIFKLAEFSNELNFQIKRQNLSQSETL